jgi:hypothetical protein
MKYYSTYDGRNFFISKNSTLPKLKLPLLQSIREQYDITDEMLENVAVTFSMKNIENGVYQVANVPADLVINNNLTKYPDEEKYTLEYKFKLRDTKKSGRFEGEFKIDFLSENGCGKITLPNNEPINIIIGDSMTKTTVI